jgi:hypothetical protein
MSEDIGYGTVLCPGCGERVPLYVMGVMCWHRDPRTGAECGHAHTRGSDYIASAREDT